MQIHRISVGDGAASIDKGQKLSEDILIDPIGSTESHRPTSFSGFIGQQSIKQKLQTAISASVGDGRALGHVLFMGPSGYGKTTLAQLAADAMHTRCILLTSYALTKPADLLSLLPTLKSGDILFVDEIHRIKPLMEEILYTAMEDRRIDMVMPDGTHMNIPLEGFTLIGATTQSHKLSAPLKNRFVYQFHMEPYSSEEVEDMLSFHLGLLGVDFDPDIISEVASYTDTVPRMIKNMAITIRDWMSTLDEGKVFGRKERGMFQSRSSIREYGLTSLHDRYLSVLKQYGGRPVGLQTIAMMLEVEPSILETDVEPLLIKQGLIEKTSRGRRLVSSL